MKTIILIAILSFLFSQLPAQQAVQAPGAAQKKSTAKLSHQIIDAPGNTFGYDIYSDGKLKVHQPSIPGQPGNGGFKTKAAAEKTAKFVIEKIKKGEMPPTVTSEDLKALKVL